ncbi:ankyrin repeat domain-containing protein SOWAHC-like [Sinocyclocheilus anshuiensis]|uniref:ankyrin repeat domain-containing protein SOWAHC-like n=1 Tax=Sinocyclocheilus anshuiensis TaxID=1608454 RepID=UPI0007B7E584|nr:PREDICTED: ankyrin repeat domain-containing protein SOWAHC-like [Sinocyclocheilus anshuiensis]
MATECTQESVLDFLLENGGRVKNKDLVAHFKVFLSSENAKRAVLKERFKRFVDNIASVKQEHGEKVVCLKKKYRYPEMRAQDEKPDDEDDDDEDINRGINALHFEKNVNMHEEISDLNPKSEEGKAVRDAEAELSVSDIALIEKDCELSDAKDNDTVHGNDVMQPNAPGLSNAQPTGEAELEAGVGRASVTPQVIISRRRTSRGSQRSLLGSSEDGAHEAPAEDGSTPKCSRKNFIELMMSSSPQVGQVQMHIQEYVDVRDYSGKKAAQYLRSSVTCDIKDIIGACANSDAENASGAGRWKLPKVLQSNLNPLRLLNHPEEMMADAQPRPRSLYRKSSISRIRLQRNRFKTQIVHSTSFRENEEGEESLKSPVKSRPLSNLFG